MIIRRVDCKRDLYNVKDVIDGHTLDRLSKEVLEALPHTKQGWQEGFDRRLIAVLPGSVFEHIDEIIKGQKEVIGDAIGRKVHKLSTAFWFDTEGFTMANHIDNPSVETVMQIYLTNCDGVGTVFYDINEGNVEDRDDRQKWHYTGEDPETRIEFEFTKNTGYLMQNHRLQLHGVPGTVGKGQERLSVYCWIH